MFPPMRYFLINRIGSAGKQDDDERLEYYARILQPIFENAPDVLSEDDRDDFKKKMLLELDHVCGQPSG